MTVASSKSGSLQAAGPRQQPAPPAAPAAATATTEPRAAIIKYCATTCHSARLHTQDLNLETIDYANIPANAEVWEKVIKKLRTAAMPPPNAPRPDAATYESLSAWLETQIDRAAAARPNPGRTETFHRLNRSEYQNVIRDLLALDTDVSGLLPGDDFSYGFDNIAGILKISPTLLDRYMAAARKISRVAVGDPGLPPTADTFRLRSDLSQEDGVNNLPIGTRGGTAIEYNFPLDATYEIKLEVGGRTTEPHQLEVSVDGERVKLFTVDGRQARPAAPTGVDVGPPENDRLELRVPVKAGQKIVAVTFVKKTSALRETVREPFSRPHAEGDIIPFPVIAAVTITGPFEASKAAPDTPSRHRIFVCQPAAAGEEAACAKKILATLTRRAYRRPVTDADLQRPLTFYNEGRSKGSFDTGIETALRALLVSPEFLFRVEADPPRAPEAYRVNDLELASRLSFFLWSSIPDDELLDVAARGRLKDPAVLDQQVKRMLADPKTKSLATNFAGQWLLLRNLESVTPDEYIFPNFGENLRQDFRTETELFFESLLRENRSVLELLTANYTYLNERLAKWYGIPSVYGSHFRRVTLADDSRRGLLGQGSFLTVTSQANRTSVVARGKWILENLLGAPPPPPPPNVPPLKENPSGKVLTMRERMAQHRANPVCASCHARMDPLGFALENFDATGQWRTMDGTTPIDVSAVLPDGTKFDGPSGLRNMLLSHQNQLVATVAERMLTYALGRGVEYYDAPALRKIVRESGRNNYSFGTLVAAIVKSTPFQMRRTVTPAAPATVTAARP